MNITDQTNWRAYATKLEARIAELEAENKQHIASLNGVLRQLQKPGSPPGLDIGQEAEYWAKVAAEELANHPDTADSVGCDDCHTPYGENGWVDAVVSDTAWAEISRGETPLILCLHCMTRRAEQLGYTPRNPLPLSIRSGPWVHPDTETVDKLERHVAKFWGGCRCGRIQITAGAVCGHPVQYEVELFTDRGKVSRTTGSDLRAAIASIPAPSSEDATPEEPHLCLECSGSGRTDNHVTGEVECDVCKGSGKEPSEEGETDEPL